MIMLNNKLVLHPLQNQSFLFNIGHLGSAAADPAILSQGRRLQLPLPLRLNVQNVLTNVWFDVALIDFAAMAIKVQYHLYSIATFSQYR